MTSAVDLPYFDRIIAQLDGGEIGDADRELCSNVHWGLYEPSDQTDTRLAYVEAAKALTRRVCETAGLDDGLRILDVGCGFGGALQYLNDRLRGCRLVGVNLDRRQLSYARRWVKPEHGNSISLVAGDAGMIPLADASFDVILAIECIFHFRSRKAFFGEVRRLLAPGGRLVITDFLMNRTEVSKDPGVFEAGAFALDGFFGSLTLKPTTVRQYARHARSAGLQLTLNDDITTETLPTYAAIRELGGDEFLTADGHTAIDYLEKVSQRGMLTYHILEFANRS